MTQSEAAQLAGLLVVGTPGWNDDAAEFTIRKLMTWKDPDAAYEAVNQVVDSWTGMGRPAYGVIREAYTVAMRRRILNTPIQSALGGGRTLGIREGREVAARAYVKQCKLEGREPDWRKFDDLAGVIGAGSDDDDPGDSDG